jgi:hypothetical protein
MSSTLYTVGVKIVGSAAGLIRAAKDAQQQTRLLGNGMTQEFNKMARARSLLGVRSEHEVQREISRTQAAYNRMARSSTLSANEQRRAAAALRGELERLGNEMGRLSGRQRAMRGLTIGGAGVAGVGAAGYALSGPAQKAMSYDRLLSDMSNTGYAERDANGRRAGRQEMEAELNRARGYGGGTRDQNAEALNTILASGVVSKNDAYKMMPGIIKASTAASTDANDLAMIGIRATQTFGIKVEEVDAILSAAMKAGQEGGFEVKNMSKHLPQQMAMAKNLGLSGKEGFAKVLAWNQASMITAGTKDEAGNNLKDLFNEMNTSHFKRYLGDQLLGDGTPGKRGVRNKRAKDIDNMYLDYQSQGVDKVSATMLMIEKVFAKDKNYQKLQDRLRATDKNDTAGRREITNSMIAQVEGSALGKIFHNQMPLLAFMGIMNNPEYVKNVQDKARAQYYLPAGKSETAVSYDVISGTADYKLEQAREDAATAQKAAMDKLTPVIGELSTGFSSLVTQYPLLTGGAMLATSALTALAGAAGLTALALGAQGRAGLPGAGAVAGGLGKLGAVGMAGAAGYGVGTLLYDNLLAGTSFSDGLGRGQAKLRSFFGNKDAEAALRAERDFDRANQPKTMAQRLGYNGTSPLPLLQQDLKGEIVVRVTGAPGLSVQADTKTNSPRIPFRTDVGHTNTAAGF